MSFSNSPVGAAALKGWPCYEQVLFSHYDTDRQNVFSYVSLYRTSSPPALLRTACKEKILGAYFCGQSQVQHISSFKILLHSRQIFHQLQFCFPLATSLSSFGCSSYLQEWSNTIVKESDNTNTSARSR